MPLENINTLNKHNGGLRLAFSKNTENVAQLARKPITRSKQTVRVLYPSTKVGRMIQCESLLEQKAAAHFEFSAPVRRYKEQPETICVPWHKGTFKFTPDFELQFLDGTTMFIEVKPSAKLMDKILVERLQAIERYYKKRDLQFSVVTEKEVNHPIRNKNLTLLRAHKQYKYSHSQRVEIRKFLTDLGGSASVDEVISRFRSAKLVFSLLADMVITTDLDLPLDSTTIVRLPEEPDYETCIFMCRSASNLV